MDHDEMLATVELSMTQITTVGKLIDVQTSVRYFSFSVRLLAGVFVVNSVISAS